MGSRSDSLSFEATPAICEDKENNPDLNEGTNMISPTRTFGKARSIKEVRFPLADPLAQRAQSIATSIPMVEPVSSASQIPRQQHHTYKGAAVDVNAIYEHQRAALQAQRDRFERDRQDLQNELEHERKMWNAERVRLLSENAQLSLELNQLKAQTGRGSYDSSTSRGQIRRDSNDSNHSSAQSFRAHQAQFSSFSTFNNSGMPSQEHSQAQTRQPWEGPEPKVPVTRVFSEPENIFSEGYHDQPNGHLQSISEDNSFSPLSKQISPTSVPFDRIRSVPIPGVCIDSNFDGITLKSSGLENSFLPRIMTPQAETPQRTPSPNGKQVGGGGLRVDIGGLMSPLDAKLKMNAGHTPMAFGNNGSTGPASGQSTEIPSPVQEKPPAPVQTAKRPRARPSENKDSYFSFTAEDDSNASPKTDQQEQLDNDPALKGPLTLSSKNDHGQSDGFLNKLDAKLEDVKRHKSPSPTRDEDNNDHKPEPSDEGPRLRMKPSLNFGAPWGKKDCGNV